MTDGALGELRTALHLNPSFALGHTALGWALLRAGRFDEAIEQTGRALRLYRRSTRFPASTPPFTASRSSEPGASKRRCPT